MGETKQNEKRCRFCEEFDWDMYACGYVLHHQKSRGEKHGDRLVYAFPCDKFRARAGLAPGRSSGWRTSRGTSTAYARCTTIPSGRSSTRRG